MRHTPVGFKGHGGVSPPPPPPPPPPPFDLAAAIAATPPGGTLNVPVATYPETGIQNITKSPPITVLCETGVTIPGIVFQNSSGIALHNAIVTKSAVQQVCVIVQSGDSVSLIDCEFHGASVGDGLGVRLLETSNANVQGGAFHHMGGGIAIVGSDGAQVTHNDFHDLEVDGIQGTRSSNVLVDSNTFDAFFPVAGDHSDCIQFFTFGQTVPAMNITITNNTYLRTRGIADTQGIFMGDEASLSYENVTITGNAFLGTVFHGITADNVNGLLIDHNLVASYTDELPDIVAWILATLPCVNGSVTNNTATSFNEPLGSHLTWASNITIPVPTLAQAPAILAAWRAG